MPDNGKGAKKGLSRRDFLKVTAAGTAAGTLLDWTVTEAPVLADAQSSEHVHVSLCPYCSGGCGMLVRTNAAGDTVLDIVGDPDNPFNRGGLCSKGQAAIKLVNNPKRVGTPDSVHTASRTYGPMKRIGNGAWQAVTWDDALTDIATKMVQYRNAELPNIPNSSASASKAVAFLGCSHMTNEDNYVYRKLITNFYSNNIEHQARI